MKYVLPLVLVLSIPDFSGYSQQEYLKQIDSLKHELDAAKYDSTRSRLLDDISYIWYSLNLDSSIVYAKQSGDFARKCGDRKLEAQSYNSIGVCLLNQAALMSAMENFNKAYEIYHAIDDKRGEAKMVNNLGVIYSEIGEYEKSIEKFELSFKLNAELGLWNSASHALYNTSLNYNLLKKRQEAMTTAKQLQALYSQHKDMVHPAPLFAAIYFDQGQLDSARYYAEMAIEDIAVRGETYHLITARVTLAEIMLKQGETANAGNLLYQCEKQIDENNLLESKIDFLPVKAEYLAAIGQHAEAYAAQSEYLHLKDSVDKANRMNIINDLNARYETERMESEIEQQQNQLAENKVWFTAVLLVAIIMLIGLVAVFYFLKKNKRLNRLLKLQNEEISVQRQKIISSITYAKKIQQSALPKEMDFSALFKEAFIFFKPKEIISGDFYSYQIIDNKIYIAVIDCTGHGVPGAFMSLIANAKLNKVVNELEEREPGRILKSMHREIQLALNQEKEYDNAQDGLEMSLCVIDKFKNTIQFAGAGSSIMLVKHNDLLEFKGSPSSIGGYYQGANARIPEFETLEISYSENDMLVMYSDGFFDQLGGEENKKLNKPKFRQLLQQIYQQNLHKAAEMSEKFIETWRRNLPQTDDIMLIGMRL